MIRFIRRILLAALPLLVSALASCDVQPADAAVRVMLAEDGSFTVLSENPVFVEPGGEAVFEVALPKGHVCLSRTPGTEYSTEYATLRLSDVRYPTTVTMHAGKQPPLRKFFIETTGGGRTVTDTAQGLVYDGTTVRVSADPHEGYRFLGWSLDKSLDRGGTLLTTEKTLTHTVTANTFLYANYGEAGMESMLFIYDANGGVYAQNGASQYVLQTQKYHIYENSLPEKGYFVREGYQLIEYNTKPDGSGTAICPGWKIVADKDEEPYRLWCIWAKESDPADFTYTLTNTGAVITGYKGSDRTLVVPAKLGGKPVVTIKAGALQAHAAETIVLPEPIRTVEKDAIVTSEKFTTLYMHDTVTTMPDNCITNVKGWRNIRLIASHTPAFTTQNEGNFSVKWERLVNAKRQGKKVLVVVSGSSSYYGLSTVQLEEELGGEYVVVNYGTNAGTPSTAYMEMLSHFVTEGDVVVHAPEINTTTMGSTAIPWKLFRATEYYFNFWQYLDMRNYTKFFSALTEANTYRKNANLDYTKTSKSLTEYGEHVNTKNLNSSNYHSGSNIKLTTGIISGTNKTKLNEAYRRLLDKGVRVYMSCAPCNANAINQAYRSAEAQDAYMKSIADSVTVPVISHIGDYILEGRYMYNSDYHPNIPGRELRTAQLAKDLLAQFEKEEKQRTTDSAAFKE